VINLLEWLDQTAKTTCLAGNAMGRILAMDMNHNPVSHMVAWVFAPSNGEI
jgi:hypothetical protein